MLFHWPGTGLTLSEVAEPQAGSGQVRVRIEACGHCSLWRAGQENPCDTPSFTGYQINGRFTEHAVADARFAFPIPDTDSPELAAVA